jgi:predicted transposase YdaD
MKGRVMHIGQANKFDRIVKENVEFILPVIIKNMLGLEIADSQEIPNDLQYTKERKPDVLRKITDKDNNTFILHIEWQSRNEKRMVYRMAEYAAMLYRKYGIPVVQYVIYMGKGKATMPTKMDYENFKFRYTIITLKDYDYNLFLQSNDPAVKVLAILANFGKDNTHKAVETIIQEVRDSADGDLEEGRYLTQLRVLATLRNENINLKLDEMRGIKPLLMHVRRDPFYIQGMLDAQEKAEKKGMKKWIKEGKIEGKEEGMKEGIKKEKLETAKKMKKLGLEATLIAQVTNIPIAEIKGMRVANAS